MRSHTPTAYSSSVNASVKRDFRKLNDTARRTYLKKIHSEDLFSGGNSSLKQKKSVISLFWFKLTHSIFADVVKDPIFWICNAAFWIIRYFGFTNTTDAILQDIPNIGVTALSLVHRLLVFCLVFYVTQCYTRFWAQYECAMAARGRVFDSMIMARSALTDSAMWNLYRYMNAAHVLGYVGLDAFYTPENLFEPVNEEHQLLTDSEIIIIEKIGYRGGNAYRQVLVWAAHVLLEERKGGRIDKMMWQALNTEVLGMRGKMGMIHDYVNQPLSFSYVSLMNFSIYFYLIILTVSLGFGNDVDTDTVYVIRPSVLEFSILLFFSILMLGLKFLADRLQDPFKNDIEDLAVTHFVNSCAEESLEILIEFHPTDINSPSFPEMLKRRTTSVTGSSNDCKSPANLDACNPVTMYNPDDFPVPDSFSSESVSDEPFGIEASANSSETSSTAH